MTRVTRHVVERRREHYEREEDGNVLSSTFKRNADVLKIPVECSPRAYPSIPPTLRNRENIYNSQNPRTFLRRHKENPGNNRNLFFETRSTTTGWRKVDRDVFITGEKLNFLETQFLQTSLATRRRRSQTNLFPSARRLKLSSTCS